MAQTNAKTFTARKGHLTTQFTTEQWEMLGNSKDGWVKEAAAPPEVTALQDGQRLKTRLTQITVIGLEGILPDETVKDISDEMWPKVLDILKALADRIISVVNYKVEQITGSRHLVQPLVITPDELKKVESPNVPASINEAALTAINNEPPLKAAPEEKNTPKDPQFPGVEYDKVDDYTGKESGDFVAPAPIQTTVGAAALPVDADAVPTPKRPGRPAKQPDEPQA